MPPRAGLAELARLLDSVVDPIYVIDDRRRLVFLNRACSELVGRKPDELLGRECRYSSTETSDPLAALADALAPPSTASLGRRLTAELMLPGAGDEPVQSRTAVFLPWSLGPADAYAVLGWLPSPELVAQEQAEQRRTDEEAQLLHALIAKLRREASARYASARLVGDSPAMKRIRSQIAVAAGTTAWLSIVGPPGSGRSHIAGAVHYYRATPSVGESAGDAARPLVPLDAAVLGPELLQSTIRSMIRSAREKGRSGAGTLLLTDVDRLPGDAQAELAGFLKLVELPLRVISTSSVPLERHAESGRFRADLAAWLSTLVIDVPPLASRPEDVAPLAQAFVEDANAAGAKQLGGFTAEALDRLAAHSWSGETRELAELVRQACERAEGPLVGVADLPPYLASASEARRHAPPPEETIDLDAFLADVEKELIVRAMARAKSNKTTAARLLGLSRPRLYRRLVQLGLETGPVVFEEATDSVDGTAPENAVDKMPRSE